jgi:CheY-like chemotaxis protein
LVESHGGQLRRPAPGRFEVELQLADQPFTGPGANGAQRSPSRRLTLLLVNPEQAALRALASAVGSLGHRAVTASSGGEALEKARRFRFDAILAARKLPDMNWAELAASAKSSCGWIGQLLTAADPPEPGVPGVQIPAQNEEVASVLWRIDETSGV